MREERDTELKKQKKATKGKATLFGWTIGEMSPQMKIFYAILVVAILGATFWYLVSKVDKKPQPTAKKGKKTKGKAE